MTIVAIGFCCCFSRFFFWKDPTGQSRKHHFGCLFVCLEGMAMAYYSQKNHHPVEYTKCSVYYLWWNYWSAVPRMLEVDSLFSNRADTKACSSKWDSKTARPSEVPLTASVADPKREADDKLGVVTF